MVFLNGLVDTFKYIIVQRNNLLSIVMEVTHNETVTDLTIFTKPDCSSDLNPIETLWSILSRMLYAKKLQFASK